MPYKIDTNKQTIETSICLSSVRNLNGEWCAGISNRLFSEWHYENKHFNFLSICIQRILHIGIDTMIAIFTWGTQLFSGIQFVCGGCQQNDWNFNLFPNTFGFLENFSSFRYLVLPIHLSLCLCENRIHLNILLFSLLSYLYIIIVLGKTGHLV